MSKIFTAMSVVLALVAGTTSAGAYWPQDVAEALQQPLERERTGTETPFTSQQLNGAITILGTHKKRLGANAPQVYPCRDFQVVADQNIVYAGQTPRRVLNKRGTACRFDDGAWRILGTGQFRHQIFVEDNQRARCNGSTFSTTFRQSPNFGNVIRRGRGGQGFEVDTTSLARVFLGQAIPRTTSVTSNNCSERY